MDERTFRIERRIQAFRVIHTVNDVEHVYVVMAYTKDEAKQLVAEQNGFRRTAYVPGEANDPHPWHPRYGLWSVKELTEDDGPFKLYEFNRKTGDMKL